MPKEIIVTTAERAYLERRLAPLLAALRKDEELRDEFLLFVRARGGSISLAVDGRPVPGSVVPLPPPGTRLVTVDVTLR